MRRQQSPHHRQRFPVVVAAVLSEPVYTYTELLYGLLALFGVDDNRRRHRCRHYCRSHRSTKPIPID